MNQNSSVNGRLPINVSFPERVGSALIGSVFLLSAFSKRNSRLLAAAAAGYLLFRGLSGYCPAYAVTGKRKQPNPVKNINIKTTITVNRPREIVYAFWRQLGNLPLFMKHLESVDVISDRISIWKARIPGGLGTVRWKAEIIKQKGQYMLGWNSLPGAAIGNAGKILFIDAGNDQTEIQAVITYRAPLGAAGQGIARLLNPVFESMVRDDINNFKQYLESGQLPA